LKHHETDFVTRMKMAVSIREVATRAGVSRATVSKVLSGGRDTISPATQERVRRVADELGYHPNAIARSLRRRRTDVIGYYSGYATAFWQVENVQRACENFAKDLLIHGSFRHHSPESILAGLESGKIDGLVVVAPQDDPIVPALAASRLPAVALADVAAGLPSVGADDDAGGRMMADRLHARGHRRVLFRSAPEPRESARRRAVGFAARAGELGMSVFAPPPAEFPGQLTDAETALLTADTDQRCTGVACWSDEFQLATLHGALRLGLRVPEDVAVVGFGEIVFDPLTLRRLTTVVPPWPAVSRRAVELLIERIEGGRENAPAPEIVLPVSLSEGETA
jgi:DNA-binding LacI/PurR family transcriptional regulator